VDDADVELYHYARGPAKNLTVLSYAYEPETKMNWPMEWIVKYGKGRGYVANYGHVWKGDVQPVTLRSADVQVILIRALQWLAGRKVSYPVPSDFPTATATPVRPEFEGIY
jgi:type 1 glutamine amidotransferase